MSRSLWGESEAGSWTPLLKAGPGCHPPPYTHYIISQIQRMGEEALVVWVLSV